MGHRVVHEWREDPFRRVRIVETGNPEDPYVMERLFGKKWEQNRSDGITTDVMEIITLALRIKAYKKAIRAADAMRPAVTILRMSDEGDYAKRVELGSAYDRARALLGKSR